MIDCETFKVEFAKRFNIWEGNPGLDELYDWLIKYIKLQ